MKKTINRDAGNKSKGPRLQRFRALELLFKAHQNDCVSHVYIATECEADVSIHSASATESATYLEENKNYADSTAFTFASKQVLNTMVSFIDSWIPLACDSEVKFGFYCPNQIGKEKKSARSTALEIEWPEAAVLETLTLRKLEEGADASIIDSLGTLIKDEYSKQYADKELDGFLPVLEKWTTSEWLNFLNQIEWRLGKSDDAEVKSEVIELIKQSKFYGQQHEGKEGLIAASATELLEERQGLQKAKDRFVHSSDIENLFLKIASSEAVTLPDPAWKMWEQLPNPSDRRNISSKVRAVTETPPNAQIGRWSRKASSGLNTQNEFGTDKWMLALKYRIYNACADQWDDFLGQNKGKKLTHQAINKWVQEVASHCCQSIENLKSDHSYPISNPDFVEEMVWVLIDECFLAFDVEPAV